MALRIARSVFFLATLLTVTINTFTIFNKDLLRDVVPNKALLLGILILDVLIENIWQAIGMYVMWRWLRKDR